MSLTSYRAAPPRATISPLGDGSNYALTLVLLQKQKAALGGLGCVGMECGECFDFMLRFADLAATYSPAS